MAFKASVTIWSLLPPASPLLPEAPPRIGRGRMPQRDAQRRRGRGLADQVRRGDELAGRVVRGVAILVTHLNHGIAVQVLEPVVILVPLKPQEEGRAVGLMR